MWKMAGSAIAGAGLLAARQYYRNWGTTKEECDKTLPGDELVSQPAVQTTEGIWIDAPAAAVWPWLVQRKAWDRLLRPCLDAGGSKRSGQRGGGVDSRALSTGGARLHNPDAWH